MNSLILNTPQAMTNPLPNTPKIWASGDARVLTSDTFDGADTPALGSRTTNAARGGQSLPYVFTSAASWGIAGNKLVPGTTQANGTALVQLPANRSKDVTISCKLTTLPAEQGNSLYVIVRRDDPSTQSQVRLAISNTKFTVGLHIKGTSSTITGSDTPVKAGDVVALREYDGLIQTFVNGALVGSYQYPSGTFTGDYAGISRSMPPVDTFAIDEMVISETIR